MVVNTIFLTYLYLPDLEEESKKRMHVAKNRFLLGHHPSFLPLNCPMRTPSWQLGVTNSVVGVMCLVLGGLEMQCFLCHALQ